MNDESAATAVEYGIVTTVLSITIIGGMGLAFGAIEWLFADNNSEINKVLR